MADKNRVSVQFHNTLASLLPNELALLRSTNACISANDQELNGKASSPSAGARHMTGLVARVEKKRLLFYLYIRMPIFLIYYFLPCAAMPAKQF